MIKICLLITSLIFDLSLEVNQKPFEIELIVDEHISEEMVRLATVKLKEVYNTNMHIMGNIYLPAEFKKDTINATKLIAYIETKPSQNDKKIIFFTHRGVAMQDDAAYSVRGYAEPRKGVAIVSDLVVKSESSTLDQYQFIMAKVFIHEMGHLLGLSHCTDSNKCVMVSSVPTPDLFYRAAETFCDSCRKKLNKYLING